MSLSVWLLTNKDLIEVIGTVVGIPGVIGGLFYSGIQVQLDRRIRRAEMILEFTKQHRELAEYGRDKAFSHVEDSKRDFDDHPLTDDEVHFVNLMFLHLRASYYSAKAGIYPQPEGLARDIRAYLSMPTVRAVWNREKAYHDREFVAFVEDSLTGAAI